MKKDRSTVRLGVAATRRSVFSREDAIKYKNLTLEALKGMNVDFVDIDWLNEDGLMYDVSQVNEIADKFREKNVDALFVPHCNFGCEAAVTRLADALKLPVLLWGPRDEAPGSDGLRLRDSQCGLFATGKDLLRRRIPFTYMENCRLTDPIFGLDVKKFLKTAAVVKSMKDLRVGQIDTRPSDFLSVISNEGELAEKFGIHVEPWSLPELTRDMDAILSKRSDEIRALMDDVKSRIRFDCGDSEIQKMLAMKIAIRDWADKFGLSSVAIQCWDALHETTGVMPCFANSELTNESLPVACETDINGAVTATLVHAASGAPIFFADVTVRHPVNDNAELLWHCGAFPHSLSKDSGDAVVGKHYILPSECPGINEWQLKDGDVTICRFDGVGGKYSFFAAKGKTIEGPKNRGSYVWVEFADWPSIERKLVCGPYIHHVAGTYEDVIPALKDAMSYLGIEYDGE